MRRREMLDRILENILKEFKVLEEFMEEISIHLLKQFLDEFLRYSWNEAQKESRSNNWRSRHTNSPGNIRRMIKSLSEFLQNIGFKFLKIFLEELQQTLLCSSFAKVLTLEIDEKASCGKPGMVAEKNCKVIPEEFTLDHLQKFVNYPRKYFIGI